MISEARLRSAIKCLPTFPAAVAKLHQVVQDEQSCAADVVEAIKPDPALTANLLHLANSAYFGLPRQVNSVPHAVVLVGMRRMLDLAICAVFSKLLPKSLPGYGVTTIGFWTHSAAVAVLSERLAAVQGFQAPSLAFPAGLLHDMGKLAICSFVAEAADELLDPVHAGRLSFVAAERRVLGTDHTAVGADLAERWNLPPGIRDAARWHHAPDDAQQQSEGQFVDLVHVADGLAHSFGWGADVDELARSISPGAMQRLGLNVQRLERIACQATDDIAKAAALIQSNGGD